MHATLHVPAPHRQAGVHAARTIQPGATTDELIERVEQVLSARGLARSGDNVVITMGVPIGAGMSTNLLKIHQMP